MARQTTNHVSSLSSHKINGCSIKLATLLTLSLAVVCSCVLVARADPNASADVQSSSGDSVQVSNSEQQYAPKRQYFIAPRIGRSAPLNLFNQQQQQHHHLTGAPGQVQNIWSSLEEASLMAPGQIQPTRGYPGPLRSSLLFLLGNRRLIGPRSASGLLPQARIGRRASPSGLLPQPRVGRRSSGFVFNNEPLDGDGAVGADAADGADGQQEVAVAAMSDNAALNDAVESLINVLACGEIQGAPDGAIDRPTNRATTAFVPRLGKRLDDERQFSSISNNNNNEEQLERMLCGNAQDCGRLAILGALIKKIAIQEGRDLRLIAAADAALEQLVSRASEAPEQPASLYELIQRQLPRREIRASLEAAGGDGDSDSSAQSSISRASFVGTKRVAFTPRIG